MFTGGDTIDSPSKATYFTKSHVDVHGCSTELVSVGFARLKVGLNFAKGTKRSL